MFTSTVSAALVTLAAISGQPRGEVLDFSAAWCGPCQQMAPIVSRLERAGYPIRKVDVGTERVLAERFGISSIPAFVLVIDGKEVRRLVGACSEDDLLDLLSQIPNDPPVMTASNDAPPRSLGVLPSRSTLETGSTQPEQRPPIGARTQPVAVVREEPDRTASATTSGKGESSPGLLGKLFGRGKQKPEPQAPDVVRGNIGGETAAPANVLPIRNPVEASVRLRVTINEQTQLGSGTAIDSREGQTLIVTCGHLLNGWDEHSKIEVDLFLGGRTLTYVGRMIHYDLPADVGLIGIPTDEIVPTAEVGSATSRPQAGEPVVSIGCSGGAAPSHEQIQVTALNYYEGPDNIECTGVPVQGRSGGGLFNRQGQLVGVCIAADSERQRGAYAGLLAIHDLLLANGLTDLYQPSPAAPGHAPDPSLASAGSHTSPSAMSGTNASAASTSGPPAVPNSGPPAAAAADFDAGRSTEFASDGDTEVIRIIRSRQQPQAPSRVVIIDRPSARFLSFLDAETDGGEAAVRANRVPSTRPLNPASSTQPSHAVRFSTPGETRAAPATYTPGEHSRSAHLQPTALTQPVRPQRYIRSLHSRVDR